MKFVLAALASLISGAALAQGLTTVPSFLDSTGHVQQGMGTVALDGSTGSASSKTGGISSTFRLVSSLASTNAFQVKSSIGRAYKVRGFTMAGATKFLKCADSATIAVPGTTVPKFTFPLPPGAWSFDWSDIGYSFASGLTCWMTGAVADLDASALTAGDVVSLNVDYQ